MILLRFRQQDSFQNNLLYILLHNKLKVLRNVEPLIIPAFLKRSNMINKRFVLKKTLFSSVFLAAIIEQKPLVKIAM